MSQQSKDEMYEAKNEMDRARSDWFNKVVEHETAEVVETVEEACKFYVQRKDEENESWTEESLFKFAAYQVVREAWRAGKEVGEAKADTNVSMMSDNLSEEVDKVLESVLGLDD